MTDLIKVRGTDGEEHQIPVAAMDAIIKRQRHSHQLELEAYQEQLNLLEQAARAVLDAYADGADLNTLYDVIQNELTPLVEHEEAV